MTPVSSHDAHEIHLRDYLYVLKKRRKLFLGFLLAVMGFGVTFTLFERVLYRASATLLIERDNPNVVDFREVMSFDTSNTDYYQTQYQRLKSRSLVRELVRKTRLAEDPYAAGLSKGRFRDILRKFPLSGRLKEFLREPPFEDVFIRRMLQVNPIRNSRLVEIQVVHPDPEKAAAYTNELAGLFIDRNLQDRFLISDRATQLISGQLAELKEKVGAAQRKLQEYKESRGLVNIPSIREKDEFLQDAKLELVKIQAEESRLAQRYLPDHPKRIHVRSEIAGLKEKIEEEEKKILGFSRDAIEYSELEREAESSRQIYEALLKRLEETTSEAQSQASNITVVDPAEPPRVPYKPRPLLNLMLALFIGSAGGVLLAFFFEYFDSTVRIPEDIELGLGLNLLGIIPLADKPQKGKLKGELFFSPGEPSPASEALRALRTALIFKLRHLPAHRARKILVTSPNPEEGKTTVTLNLAAAFTQIHWRVLVIDADLRRPKLHKLIGVDPQKGLTEILEGEMDSSQVVRPNVQDLGFDFIPCGTTSHHPTEILGSANMKKLVDEMEKRYDVILIDMPPYLAVADVIVLSEYVDALAVVARYHKTDRRHLRDVKRRFSQAGEKFVGIVINQVSVQEKDRYYHQYYYYGYGDPAPKK